MRNEWMFNLVLREDDLFDEDMRIGGIELNMGKEEWCIGGG